MSHLVLRFAATSGLALLAAVHVPGEWHAGHQTHAVLMALVAAVLFAGGWWVAVESFLRSSP